MESQIVNSTLSILADGQNDVPNLSWANVGIASSFILVNGLISLYLGLKLEKSLLTSSIRCVVQLTLMGQILQSVFNAKNPILVMLMTFLLIFLSSCETVYNKSDWSFNHMFPSVLFSTLFSSIFISVLGTRFAMNQKESFWLPELFIPTLGLLLGITTGAMAVGLTTVLTKVGKQTEIIETYLSCGATRWEAGKAVAIEAIRLAMLPSINSMSVIGLITIPGAMTGQILGGAPIMNAVRYQQIITFMISATASLAVLSVVYFAVHHMFDNRHRLRPERVHKYKASPFRDIMFLLTSAWSELFHHGSLEDHRSDDDRRFDNESRHSNDNGDSSSSNNNNNNNENNRDTNENERHSDNESRHSHQDRHSSKNNKKQNKSRKEPDENTPLINSNSQH